MIPTYVGRNHTYGPLEKYYLLVLSSSYIDRIKAVGRYWWWEFQRRFRHMTSFIRAALVSRRIKRGQVWQVIEFGSIFYHVKPYTYPIDPPTLTQGDRFIVENYPATYHQWEAPAGPSWSALSQRVDWVDIVTATGIRGILLTKFINKNHVLELR